jgi:hypothetical protein
MKRGTALPHFIFTARHNFYKVRGFVQVGDVKKCKDMLADRPGRNAR